MFDKIKFANALKKIREIYNSQEEFSKVSGISRTYLSKYMNLKIETAPKPNTLAMISKSSKGTVSYEDLMIICGYTSKNFIDIHSSIYKKYENKFKELLSDEKIEYILKLFNPLYPNRDDFINNTNELLNDLPKDTADKVYELLMEFSQEFSDEIDRYGFAIKEETSKRFTNNTILKLPVVGKIAAGQPILANEYIEEYLPVIPDIYGISNVNEYFYLRVQGDSMNLRVQDGDYVIIHKQDYAEDGDMIVAIVNSDSEATLKLYRTINTEIIQLVPKSNNPIYEPITINLKETNFIIIGKAIGKFGKF